MSELAAFDFWTCRNYAPVTLQIGLEFFGCCCVIFDMQQDGHTAARYSSAKVKGHKYQL